MGDPVEDMDMDDGMAGEYNADNVLQVPTKSFTEVLRILDNVNKEKKKDLNKNTALDKARAYNPSAPVPRMGYSRYEQEKFKPRNEADGFKIDARPFKNPRNPLETPNHVPR